MYYIRLCLIFKKCKKNHISNTKVSCTNLTVVFVYCINLFNVYKVSGTCSKRISQTLLAGFSKQNYYEKNYKNQQNNIKITKIDLQWG